LGDVVPPATWDLKSSKGDGNTYIGTTYQGAIGYFWTVQGFYQNNEAICKAWARNICVADTLYTSDTIAVSWRSSSGGKSKLLFEYVVNNGGESYEDK
jgi:hypothetical protein